MSIHENCCRIDPAICATPHKKILKIGEFRLVKLSEDSRNCKGFKDCTFVQCGEFSILGKVFNESVKYNIFHGSLPIHHKCILKIVHIFTIVLFFTFEVPTKLAPFCMLILNVDSFLN